MITLDVDTHYLALRLAEATGLSQDQSSALTTELQNTRYIGKTAIECLCILHDPTQDTQVVYGNATGKELKEWMAPYARLLRFGREGITEEKRAEWLQTIAWINTAYEDTYVFDPQSAPTFTQFAAGAVTDGVITQADVDEFKRRYESTIYVSPVRKLFGAGVFVEIADIEAVL